MPDLGTAVSFFAPALIAGAVLGLLGVALGQAMGGRD